MSKKENRLGVNNLKVILSFTISLAMVIITLGDKKGFFRKLSAFLSLMDELPAVFLSAKMAIAEAGDLISEEIDVLRQYVKDEFDIEDDRAELVVEHAIDAGVGIHKLIYAIKGLKVA